LVNASVLWWVGTAAGLRAAGPRRGTGGAAVGGTLSGVTALTLEEVWAAAGVGGDARLVDDAWGGASNGGAGAGTRLFAALLIVTVITVFASGRAGALAMLVVMRTLCAASEAASPSMSLLFGKLAMSMIYCQA